MKYEHKEYIEQFLGVHDEDAQKELDCVYIQAKKAREHERKAKLADKLISELRDSSYYVNSGTKDIMLSMCLTAIKRYEKEEE